MENCCSQGQEKTAKLKTDCYYLNIELDRKTRWFWLCSKHSVYCFHCNSGQQLDNSKQPLHSRISHNNKYQHIKKCIQKQKQTHMDVTKYVKLHQHLTKYTPTMLCIPRSPSISSQVDFSALFGNSEITDFNNSSMCNTAVILPLPTQKHVIHDIWTCATKIKQEDLQWIYLQWNISLIWMSFVRQFCKKKEHGLTGIWNLLWIKFVRHVCSGKEIHELYKKEPTACSLLV